jgi:hypothetical protein
MLLKTGLVLALSTALVGAMSSRASAQVIEGGVYIPAPQAYVEIGPPPGLGYVWIPGHRRWEYHPELRYYNGRDGWYDRDGWRGAYHRDRDDGRYRRDRDHRDYDRGRDRR